jgi:hypothetical protein
MLLLGHIFPKGRCVAILATISIALVVSALGALRFAQVYKDDRKKT